LSYIIAAVNEPVRDRNISQFREGTFGRKFSPNPIYFHIGLGGGSGFAGFGIVFTSGRAAELVLYLHVSTMTGN
jgi:hypothetical protein